MTAQYAAPALYAFCRWIVDTAAARGWKRLYFLSRDGYWMRMLCEEISRTLGLELECRYLYASRMAWRAPCFHLAGEEGWEQLFQPAPGITLLGVLGGVGLSREEASHWADLAGIPPEERERGPPKPGGNERMPPADAASPGVRRFCPGALPGSLPADGGLFSPRGSAGRPACGAGGYRLDRLYAALSSDAFGAYGPLRPPWQDCISACTGSRSARRMGNTAPGILPRIPPFPDGEVQ